MGVNYKPQGFHTVTPYLIVHGAGELITFMSQAFGAEETFRTNGADGAIRHASVKIDDSIVELSDASEAFPARPAALHIYVEDTDAVYAAALAAGATSTIEPRDEFYGDRAAGVRDPFGNDWFIATQQQAVSPDELERRMAAL